MMMNRPYRTAPACSFTTRWRCPSEAADWPDGNDNLIGSARSYVGYEQGGLFAEALRRRPFSVVLLDEIEKAHPDVLNVFLSVFDDGQITDRQGKVVDCSNAVFILTPNIMAEEVKKIGFTAVESGDLRAQVAQLLRPELVNRITEVIRFAPLGHDELARIAVKLSPGMLFRVGGTRFRLEAASEQSIESVAQAQAVMS
jgi:ATP-dependent Clp protease ATP-binding subunit ClpA